MATVDFLYCGNCGLLSQTEYWLLCPCRGQPIRRMAVRAEDAEQVRDAIRRGGRVRVGQQSYLEGEHHGD